MRDHKKLLGLPPLLLVLILLAFAIMMSPAFSGGAAAGLEVGVNSQPVNIPDPNLEAAIRDIINKPSGDITVSDMEKLWFLYPGFHCDIVMLTGLEYAVNLETIQLSGQKISDISPLAGLTGLGSLSLSSNQIMDISPLAGLKNLYHIDLGGNQIADISPLAGLTGLSSLSLSGNQIADISPLAGLIWLEYLYLGNNQLTDISPLSSLTRLVQLNLSNNLLCGSGVSGLTGLANLNSLNISNNMLTSIPALPAASLNYLYLSGNMIIDVSALTGLTKLYYVELNDNSIADLPDLSGLTELNWLHLERNQLTDISNLFQLDNVRIDLRHNELDTNSGSPLFLLLSETNLVVIWFPQSKVLGLGTIKGCITTASAGEPVDWAYLEAKKTIDNDNRVFNYVYTDADGCYEIELPVVSGYTVSAYRNDSPKVYAHHIDVKESEDIELNLEIPDWDDEVVIPDQNLKGVISEVLNKTDRNITYRDMRDLEELNAASHNIRELSGLEYAHLLKKLDLSHNLIEDFSPLSDLRLEQLELAGNQIRDISILPHVTILYGGYLDLRKNYIDTAIGGLARYLINRLVRSEVSVHYEPQSIQKIESVKTPPGKYTATLNFAHANTMVEVASDSELSASIYLNRYDDYPMQHPVATDPAGIYLHIGSDGDLQGAAITVKVAYDPEALPEGVAEESLRLRHYRESTGFWEEPLPQGVNTEEHFVWAEVSDFSVFGVFADKPLKLGDVNGDDQINVSDAILMLRNIVGLAAFSENQKAAARVSGSAGGNVDVGDAIQVLRYIVGLISRFPAEGPLP